MKKNEYYTEIIVPEDLQCIKGGYEPDRDGYYRILFAIGYGIAALKDYMSEHSLKYGLAFK